MNRHFTRREILRFGVGAGSLIALGLAPHLLAAGLPRPQTDDFSFAVLSDLHYRDQRCAGWLATLVRAVRAHGPAFCVMNGDITELGKPQHLAAVRDAFRDASLPLHVTIGNHDYLTDDDRSGFERVFPQRLNYHFEVGGWQFLGIDSTEGQRVFRTRVSNATLSWLDETLPGLDCAKPMVLFTHFPLGPRVITRPLNAPAVLERFRGYDLRAVFNGHWHGYSLREIGRMQIVNSRCCSWWATNNDGSPFKGFFLCRVKGATLRREYFVVEHAAGA